MKVGRIALSVALLATMVAMGAYVARPDLPPPTPKDPEPVPIVAMEDGTLAEWLVESNAIVASGTAILRLDNPKVEAPIEPPMRADVATVPFGTGAPPLWNGRPIELPRTPVQRATPAAPPVPAEPQDLSQFEAAVQAAEQSVTEANAVKVQAAAAVEVIEKGIVEAESRVSDARAKADKNRGLYELGAISRKVFERTESDANQAAETVAQLKRDLDQAKLAAEESEVASEEAIQKAEEAKAELERRRKQEPQNAPAAVPAPTEESKPATIRGRIASAPVAPPAPVMVVVDDATLKELESLQRQAAEARDRLVVRSVSAGRFRPAKISRGALIRKGDVVGWIVASVR